VGGKLNPDEMNGSAFTVADFGMYGVDSYTADCRETETAVLASGAVKKRAVVMPDGTIAARDMLWLSLSYDPLAIDADEAARFLHRVSRFLENPILML
jgi:pyruvate dehydrogenase E2 component (dihydrolipoamide acetyltransferase)